MRYQDRVIIRLACIGWKREGFKFGVSASKHQTETQTWNFPPFQVSCFIPEFQTKGIHPKPCSTFIYFRTSKHVRHCIFRNTTFQIKPPYIILFLERFSVEWSCQFLNLCKIDLESLFLVVKKILKFALTKLSCSKWFSRGWHWFFDILK